MGNSCVRSLRGHQDEEHWPAQQQQQQQQADDFDPFRPYGVWHRGWWRRRLPHGRFLFGGGGGGSVQGLGGVGDMTALYGGGPASVRDCIRRMLQFVVENYDNDAKDLQKRIVLFHLHGFSASERTFLLVIDMLLDEVPIDHSLSGSIISMVICGGCLPTKELLADFMSLLGLSSPSASETRQKNALSAVAAFAGRLSGALADWLATDALLAFVHSRLARLAPAAVCEAGLRPHREPSDPGLRAEQLQVALAAALLLQTFMHTFSEAERQRLLSRLSSDSAAYRPSFAALLTELEHRHAAAEHGPAKQMSSLSATLLDGYLRPADRCSAWQSEVTSGQRQRRSALLSPTASTDAVQILPNGLEARSDAPGFETAVAGCGVSANIDGGGGGGGGRWYYEATLVTDGVMQIGWASTDTPLLRDEGLGVGDDAASVGIDGCRGCLWHRGRQDRRRYRWRRWRVGDVVGCLLEFSAQHPGGGVAGGWASARFSLNGTWSSSGSAIRLPATGVTYRPAASLMANQQVRFNFGGVEQPFRYRPPTSTSATPASVASASTAITTASSMEEAASSVGGVSAQDRRLLGLPWPLAMRERRLSLMMSSISPPSSTLASTMSKTPVCLVCADRPSGVRLMPCGHSGLCSVCPGRLAACPLCRVELTGCQPDTAPSFG